MVKQNCIWTNFLRSGVRKAFLLNLICGVFLPGCQPDFEINKAYQEEVIVYGLLNPQDSVQYVRITRSVLNSDGELLDSVICDPDLAGFEEPLEVWVEKWNEKGRIDHPIQFFPDPFAGIDQGLSATGKNTIYSSTRIIDPGFKYRLFVINHATGKTITASCYTIAADDLRYQIDNTYSSVTVQSLDSVYFYQTEMFFSFVEVTDTDTVYRRIPLFKHTLTNESKAAGATKLLSLDRPDVMQYIGNSIESMPGVKRYAREKPYDFRLILGDEVLFDYQNTLYSSDLKYQAAQPITNINGGKGIFSSVHWKSLGSIYMLPYWYVALSKNKYVKHLNFQAVSWYE